MPHERRESKGFVLPIEKIEGNHETRIETTQRMLNRIKDEQAFIKREIEDMLMHLKMLKREEMVLEEIIVAEHMRGEEENE